MQGGRRSAALHLLPPPDPTPKFLFAKNREWMQLSGVKASFGLL
jgi:hypothetical protein